MSNKITLIIQPHSDDAMLSCGSFLLANISSLKIEVLTIENNLKRVKEDELLFSFIGIPLHNLGLNLIDDCYKGFYKIIGNKSPMKHDFTMKYLNEYFTPDAIKEVKNKLISFILENEDKYEFIAPLGIGHPFHYLIFDIVKDLSCIKYFYREFPHSFKRRVKDQFDNATKNMKLHYFNDEVELHDLKFKISQKFYKSQSRFFFNEQQNINKYYREEIYEKS